MRYFRYRNGRELPLEQQTYVEPSGRTWPGSARFFINRFNCRLTEYERVGGNRKIPLLDGHGYLVSEFEAKRLAYYTPEGVRGSTTIPIEYIDTNFSLYSTFLDAYFFPRRLLEVNSRSGLSLWVLKPGSEIREEFVPGGPWFGASKGYHVSRAGIVIWSSNRVGTSGDGFAGIYLAHGGNVVRILPGFAQGMQVSPDGCRIAARLERANRVFELKIVDVCKGRG